MLSSHNVQWPQMLASAGINTSSPKSRSRSSTTEGKCFSVLSASLRQPYPVKHLPSMTKLCLCRYIHLREVMTDDELRETIDPVRDLPYCFKLPHSQLKLSDPPARA